MLIPYPTPDMAQTKPPLISDPVILHQFDWTNKQNPRFWVQTENQIYQRSLLKSKSPYQIGNLNAFRTCLADRANGVILDIGANNGLMAYQFASWGADVIAFEPVIKIAEMCAYNMVLNGVSDKVKIHHAAMVEQCGVVSIYDIPNQSHVNTLTKGRPNSKKKLVGTRSDVQGISIDSLNLEQVDGIKIDTEGWEYQIVLGATNTIKRCRPIVMAEMIRGHFKGYQPDQMYDWFDEIDYVPFYRGKSNGFDPRRCGRKWTYRRSVSDRIFVPKEHIPEFKNLLFEGMY